MAKRIYLNLAHMSESGAEMKYIQEAFDTNWVVPLSRQGLCLPSGPCVTDDDARYIVEKIKDAIV